ncbi:MAG: response regulator [Chloroflexota bacterium]
MIDPSPKQNRNARRAKRLDIDDWHVLIVDDQRDNLNIATEALRFHGAHVQTASNGIEGLEILETYSPTLVLLDLSMPEMNGWDMLKAMRDNPDTQKIPVIALTAHVMAGDEANVMAAGFDGYIPKPFSVATIVLKIQSILAQRQRGDAV